MKVKDKHILNSIKTYIYICVSYKRIKVTLIMRFYYCFQFFIINICMKKKKEKILRKIEKKFVFRI